MRITGGELRNRILEAPTGTDIRPATDKVRLAVFNSLLSRIDLQGCHIFDGFCGTGAYGIEALSRGAAFCTFIDNAPESMALSRRNVKSLDLGTRSKFMQKDLLKLPPRTADAQSVDLIFLDPPYRQGLLRPALDHLQQTGWLCPEALCVLECERPLEFAGGQNRHYGDIQIIYITLPELYPELY